MQRNKNAAPSFVDFKKVGFIVWLLILVGILSACFANTNDVSVSEAVDKALADQNATRDAITVQVEAEIAARDAAQAEQATQVAEQVNATVNAALAASPDSPDSPGDTNNAAPEDLSASANRIASLEAENADLNAQVADLESEVDDLETDMTAAAAGPGGGGGGDSASLELIVSANIRQGPGTNYQVITTLGEGVKLPILAKNCSSCISNNTWYNVTIPTSGRNGWVNGSIVKPVDGSDLSGVSLASNIPPPPNVLPTATPSPTPTPTATAIVTSTVTPAATSTVTPTPTITPTATAATTTIFVVNNSASTICNLIIHPSTTPGDENRLQNEDPLLPGGQITVLLTEGTTKFYDFEARDCGADAVVADDDGIEVFDNYVWTIN